MVTIPVQCPHCHSTEVIKAGKQATGAQRYQCQNGQCARRIFLLQYQDRGRVPEVRRQVVDMAAGLPRSPSARVWWGAERSRAQTRYPLGIERVHDMAHGLIAGGHLTWLDATYDHYIAVNYNNVAGDVSGNRLNNAPEWSGRLWVQWNGDIGASRRLSIAVDTSAQSTVFYTPFNDNIQFQKPYGLLGARVEYGPRHRHWAIAAYARNLTNSDYITATFGTSPVAFGGRPGPQRQLAIDFTVRR